MREPAFWYRPSSLRSFLLMPLAAIYGAVAGRRLQRAGIDSGVPVICVGNYHVGGAGKTPTVLALSAMLRHMGETPVVLSRGYGGRLPGPVKVDANRHLAEEVGDEPLMMAQHVPVVIARDRVAGAAFAKLHGASVVLMDDGFQNPAIVKDASLIVIDAGRGIGNGQVLPSGPLRAPLSLQLPRTDALIVIGEGMGASDVAAAVASRGKPVISAQIVADEKSAAALRGKRVLAFAGIGDPDRFFRTLRAQGIDVAETRIFADHHPFSDSDVEALIADAARGALVLVATEKDIVRLRTREGLSDKAAAIVPLAVTLRFQDEETLRSLISGKLAQARARKPARAG